MYIITAHMYANLIIKTLSQIFSNTLLQFQIVLYTSIFLLKLCAVIYLYIFYLVILIWFSGVVDGGEVTEALGGVIGLLWHGP